MTKQKGFSIIELLLILLLLLGLGFGGYYVWHNHNKKSKKASSSSSQSSKSSDAAAAKDSTSTDKTTAPASTQKYLTITEWGVKIPLGTATADAKYVIKNGYVYLSLTSLDGTECSVSSESVGALTRFLKADVNPDSPTGETYFSAYPNAPKVGNYYFIYGQSNGTCLNGDIPTAVTANTEFKANYLNIVAQ